jgi:HEAT repeat protein
MSLERVLLTLAAILPCGAIFAAAPPPSLEESEVRLLRRAGLATDNASLLADLRKQSVARADDREIDRLIEQLGADSFEQREAASRQLVVLGRVAMARLMSNRDDPDLEVRVRVRRCITQFESGVTPNYTLPTIRLLIKRRAPGTVEALFGYLPFARSADVEEEVYRGIDALAAGKDGVAPLLVSAMNAPYQAKRAMAGCIVARAGSAAQREVASRLLKDPYPEVRLRVAQGLLAVNDHRAIPALIELLASPELPITWQAEELLYWSLDPWSPPRSELPGADRQRLRATWRAWWAEAGKQVRLGSKPLRTARPRLLLITEKDTPGRRKDNGRLWLCGSDGSCRWELTGLDRPVQAAMSRDGPALLLQEGRILARSNWEGTVHWQVDLGTTRPRHLHVENDGEARLVTTDGRGAETIDVSPDGKSLFRTIGLPPPDDPDGPRTIRTGTEGEQYIAWPLSGGTLLRLRQVRWELSVLEEHDSAGRLRWECLRSGDVVDVREPWGLVGLGIGGQGRATRESYTLDDRVAQLQSSDILIRRYAIHVLDEQANVPRRFDDTLIAALSNADPLLRQTAAAILARRGSAILAPVRRMARTGGPEARALAIRLLGQMSAERSDVAADLIAGLKDSEREVRTAAVAALAGLGEKGKPAMAALLERLGDTEERVRQEAAKALGAIGKHFTREISEQMLRRRAKATPSLRVSVDFTFQQLAARSKDTVPMLADWLKDARFKPLRLEIVGVLGAIGPDAKDAVPELARLLRGKDETMTSAVIAALKRMRGAAVGAVEELLNLAQTADDTDICIEAVQALGIVGHDGKDVIAALQKIAAMTKDDDLRIQCRFAIAQIRKANARRR